MSSFRRFILMAGLIPMMGLLISLGINSSSNWQTISATDKVIDLADLSQIAGGLAHELQKERGMSAGFLSSDNDSFLPSLNKQRALADSKLEPFKDILTRNWMAIDPTLEKDLRAIEQKLAKRSSTQAAVDARDIAVSDNVGYYTPIVVSLIDLIHYVSKLSPDAKLTAAAGATRAFLMAKEKAGLERAIGSVLFNQGMTKPAVYATYLRLVAEQNAYLDDFKALGTEADLTFVENTVKGSEVDEVMRRRTILIDMINTGDNQGLDAKEWFDLATVRINGMKTVEDTLLVNMKKTAAALKADAWQMFFIGNSICLFFLIAGLLMTVNINKKVKSLQEAEEQARLDAQNREQEAIRNMTERFEAELGGIVKTLGEDASQLKVASHTLNSGAERGQQESAAVALTFEQTNRNIQIVATSTEELSVSVDEISKQVNQSSNVTREALAQTEQTDQTVNELSAAGQKIGEVVSLISAIAEQTNLLALNATIEAARAGEAGKGFAVVAQEVKNLAAQTTSATEQIIAQIGSVQDVSEQTVTAVKMLRERFEEIDSIMSTIALSVQEQGSAANDIAKNTQQAAQGTSAVFESIETVKTTACDTGSAANQVKNTADNFASQIDTLTRKTREFVERCNAA